jgi:hypothetical protein
MGHGPIKKRPLRTSSEEARVPFNWPPTDEELAQYSPERPQRDPEIEAARMQPAEPLDVDLAAATDALELFPSETSAPRLPAVPQEPSQTPSDSRLVVVVGDRPAALFPRLEAFRADSSSPSQSRTPGDGAQTRYFGEDFGHARTEAMPTSGIAVSLSTTALDLPGTGDLADEIAALQALIGGLTQPIQWRVPNVTGR